MSQARKTLTQALNAAGQIIHEGLSREKNVSFKGPVSLLTEIDKRAERAILRILRKNFPTHSILTEETGSLMKRSDYTWIIDPLDGTTNYAHALPHTATSIALRHHDQIILAGVYDSARKELFLAEHGKGAQLNGKSIHVSRQSGLNEAVLLSGFPYDRRQKATLYMKPWSAFMQRTQAMRWQGAAALDICWVACGRAEGFWSWRLQPWDCAAGVLIVEEAGGEISDFSGQPYDLFGSQTLVSNGAIHKKLLAVFRTTGTYRHR